MNFIFHYIPMTWILSGTSITGLTVSSVSWSKSKIIHKIKVSNVN